MSDRMKARERYKERLKLRRAITDVLSIAQANHQKGIPPDKKTALMAIQIIVPLTVFCESVGLTKDKWRPDKELADFFRIMRERGAETKARRRRRFREMSRLL
jgi:hypothetical protein